MILVLPVADTTDSATLYLRPKMSGKWGNLLDLLYRIFVKREKLEKASLEEVQYRMVLLSILCVYAIIFFHGWGYAQPFFDKLKTGTDVFIFMIIPFAVIGGISFFAFMKIFSYLNKLAAISIGLFLMAWVVIEIVVRTKNV